MNGARISAIWWNAEWISCLAYWRCSWWMLREHLFIFSLPMMLFFDTCMLLLLLFRCVCQPAGCHIPSEWCAICCESKWIFSNRFHLNVSFRFHRVNLLEQTQKPLHCTRTHCLLLNGHNDSSKFYANKIYLLHCYTRRVCVLYFEFIALRHLRYSSSNHRVQFLRAFLQNMQTKRNSYVESSCISIDRTIFYLLFALMGLWEHRDWARRRETERQKERKRQRNTTVELILKYTHGNKAQV